jgi:hypothetical protein
MMTFPALDPELLQAFVAVADQRSFTRAAAALNRTQSAVSMQIKRLEERVGVELFHRTKANVDLSSAGEGLLGYARRILTLNDEAVARLREHKVAGVVRLGVMDDYGTAILPPILATFLASYPLIHVEMETGLTSGMPARLGEAYDLVIAMHPVGRGDGEFLRREQAVEAIAAQGLAVTVTKRGTFPARLRALGESDGMPPLPAADICLHRATKLSHAGALLADHLRMTILDETLLPHRPRHPQRPAKPGKMLAQT